MKKLSFLALILSVVFILSNCGSSKRMANSAVTKLTYESNLVNLIAEKCSPCHLPSKGGKKKAYDNFTNVKTDIDEIIRRIELNPTDKGFMPFKKTAKLNDSTINVFKKWREDGLLEK